MMAKKPPQRINYMAGVEIHRGGVVVHIAEVPAGRLECVVRHALASLSGAGVTDAPDDGSPIEQVGNYAPLEVRDDDGGGKRRRVGFSRGGD